MHQSAERQRHFCIFLKCCLPEETPSRPLSLVSSIPSVKPARQSTYQQVDRLRRITAMQSVSWQVIWVGYGVGTFGL